MQHKPTLEIKLGFGRDGQLDVSARRIADHPQGIVHQEYLESDLAVELNRIFDDHIKHELINESQVVYTFGRYLAEKPELNKWVSRIYVGDYNPSHRSRPVLMKEEQSPENKLE